ncbi:hypothetical protein HDV62DRAFT_108069 [Trichoderma sp. SZMC 28011]
MVFCGDILHYSFFHIHIPTYIHICVWHFPAFAFVFVHSDIKGGWREGVWFGLAEALALFGCVSLLGRFSRSYDGDVLFLRLCSLYNGVLYFIHYCM